MEDLNKNSHKKRGLGKGITILLVAGTLIGTNLASLYVGNNLALKGLIVKEIPGKAKDDLLNIGNTNDYEALFNLREMIYAKYDGELDESQLVEGAMKGMAEAVGDPYTVYMNPEEFQTFLESSEGSFSGIGAQLGVQNEKITIIAPLEDSPAEAAGVKAGDVILQVDDYIVTDTNTDAVVAKVRGEVGTKVKLLLQREESEPFEVEIIRDEIVNQTVLGEMIEDSIGYIQISSFSDEKVSEKFTNKLDELKEQGMSKLILDLRGNPGGYLDQCIEIASHFIEKDEVVTYTIDKYDEKAISPSKGGELLGMPLVVIVDGGSASASEVVTGALRDHGAATIVGTNTFGKGIVQQLLELPESNGGLKVTTSRYYTPNGENIHGTGIAPDIEVTIPEEILQQEYDRNIDPQFKKALEIIREK